MHKVLLLSQKDNKQFSERVCEITLCRQGEGGQSRGIGSKVRHALCFAWASALHIAKSHCILFMYDCPPLRTQPVDGPAVPTQGRKDRGREDTLLGTPPEA